METRVNPIDDGVRAGLTKLATPRGIEVLQSLIDQMQSVKDGVLAKGFRVAFRDERELIDKLIQRSFVKRSSDFPETYRPTLTALTIIQSDRANELLNAVDAILRLMARRLEYDPNNPDLRLSVIEIVDSVDMPEDLVIEALRYLEDTPMQGSRTLDFPNSLESSLCVGEQSLDFDSVDALVIQLSEWAGRSAAMPLFVDYSDGTPQISVSLFDRAIEWIKNHRILAPLMVLAVILMTAVAFLSAISDFLKVIKSWIL